MHTLIAVIQLFFGTTALLAALLSIVYFFQCRWPAAVIWALKVSVSALSSVFMFIGLLALLAGIATGTSFLILIGAYVTLVYLLHFIRVTRPPASASGFEQAFGRNWKDQILPEQQKYFLSRRTALRMPTPPKPRVEQDISFATIPGTDFKLLCDIWQPPAIIKPSGLAYIYLHGGAFYTLDKNFRTRVLFTHLAAQGHVIMDVAYRLAPETDLMGMIQDVKRAVAWIKDNAERYSVDPDRIIVGGGSSGAYLALMAAYTNTDPGFTPSELKGKDTSCSAVIAEYPVSDLAALYHHTNESINSRPENNGGKKKSPKKVPAWLKKIIGKDFDRLRMDKGIEKLGTIAPLLGGPLDQCPETYNFFSPFTYVSSKCPPTLLIHGYHDIMSPVKSTCLLYDKLIKQKVPAILHIIPQTDHAFNRFLPQIAPAAHNALYDAERFMALIAKQATNRD